MPFKLLDKGLDRFCRHCSTTCLLLQQFVGSCVITHHTEAMLTCDRWCFETQAKQTRNRAKVYCMCRDETVDAFATENSLDGLSCHRPIVVEVGTNRRFVQQQLPEALEE